ncbi:MAG: GntR family transcriptional regulator [Pseudomonadota bacterium]|nr:GntR family transcriptional regulator [Pseudomonadota bacterium]
MSTAVAERPKNLAERIYQQVKQDIFDFQWLPGDRFSESEIARRMNASRTPVREALYRLERDGYVQVHFRSGWQVRPFDFRYFEDLYDVRILLESESVRRLCQAPDREERLAGLMTIWCCKTEQRMKDHAEVAFLDEEFHFGLVESGRNQEMVSIHRDVCERLRIIRRLDFTQPGRIDITYDEHSQILNDIVAGNTEAVISELVEHIEVSKNTVRDITLHRIQEARQRYAVDASMK